MNRHAALTVMLAGTLLPAVAAADPGAPKPTKTLSQQWNDAVSGALAGRCATAICFGGDDGYRFAIEPLADIPVGKTFALWPSDTNSLAGFVNNHDFSATFSAGLRFWAFHDIVSGSIYLAAPLFNTDDKVRILGDSFQQPSSRIRSPYPSFALGFLADTLWVGFQYIELRNGAADDSTRDFAYPRNAVISQVWTATVALAPITAIRNGLGAASKKSSPPADTTKPTTTGSDQTPAPAPSGSTTHTEPVQPIPQPPAPVPSG